jgi:chemotaxis signal transduction protein
MKASSQQVVARSADAQSMTANFSPQPTAQYLTFMLAGEMFAIDILGVNEILEYQTVTDVPMMPAYVRGIINRRGAANDKFSVLLDLDHVLSLDELNMKPIGSDACL